MMWVIHIFFKKYIYLNFFFGGGGAYLSNQKKKRFLDFYGPAILFLSFPVSLFLFYQFKSQSWLSPFFFLFLLLIWVPHSRGRTNNKKKIKISKLLFFFPIGTRAPMSISLWGLKKKNDSRPKWNGARSKSNTKLPKW